MESGRPPNHKPKLTIAEQIEDLRRRGVRFNADEESLARACLASRRSLLHLSAYRELFPKHLEGPNKGKYIDLSFTDLITLDELDGQLRDTFLCLSLQVENAARMQILSTISEMRNEDGYEVVEEFLQSLPPAIYRSLKTQLDRRGSSTSLDIYTGQLINKYSDDMPIWVFVEITTFGTLLSLYRFCAKRWRNREMLHSYYMLKQVKDVRNACGHQNCIINGFVRQARSVYKVTPEVMSGLSPHGLTKSRASKEKLGNIRIQELVSTLYAAHIFGETSRHALSRLEELDSKLGDAIDVYGPPVKNAFTSYLLYLRKVMRAWFPLDKQQRKYR